MRPEELYLTDIVEAADAIQRFIEGIHMALRLAWVEDTREEFCG